MKKDRQSSTAQPDSMSDPMPKAGPLGVNISRLRHRRGLTQDQLAELADVSRATIAKLETGAALGASTRILDKLAKALGVESSVLAEVRRDESYIEEALAAFLASPWAGTLTPPVTRAELDELRAAGGGTWVIWRPTPETLHYMVRGLRASRTSQK